MFREILLIFMKHAVDNCVGLYCRVGTDNIGFVSKILNT